MHALLPSKISKIKLTELEMTRMLMAKQKPTEISELKELLFDYIEIILN